MNNNNTAPVDVSLTLADSVPVSSIFLEPMYGRDLVANALKRKLDNYETTINVNAGELRIAAAFINDYYNPRDPDEGNRDRNLQVSYLEVDGPLQIAADSLPASHRAIITAQPGGKTSLEEAAQRVLLPLASRAFRRPATREDSGLFMCVSARNAILFAASASVRPETSMPPAATPGAMRGSAADAVVGAIKRSEAKSSSKVRRMAEKPSRTFSVATYLPNGSSSSASRPVASSCGCWPQPSISSTCVVGSASSAIRVAFSAA